MTVATQKQQLPLQQPPSRMTLKDVVRGKIHKPIRALLYGPEGIGKSTFGAGAPAAIFLGAEEGTAQLDVVRFPRPESFAEVMDALRTLSTEKHEYKTLVVDTLDWLEPLIWSFICQRDGEKDIESYGYGKGYTAALDQWRVFIRALERVWSEKGMNVVLLAHAWIKSFKNPTGEDYDRYELKLNAKASGLAKEWCDAVLFAQYETYAKEDKKTKRVRGVDTGARLIFTERRAAWDAKNRYSLPEQLPLAWSDFAAAVDTGKVAEPTDLKAEIQRKAAELGGDLEKVILETLAKAGSDATNLALINNRCNARLAEKAAAQTTATEAEKAS